MIMKGATNGEACSDGAKRDSGVFSDFS